MLLHQFALSYGWESAHYRFAAIINIHFLEEERKLLE